MRKRMVVDVSNIFWRSISAMNTYDKPDPSESAALGLHGCLMTLKKYFNNIKPHEMCIVFEGRNNWRKEYTKSENSYSKRIYKANRVSDPSMAVLYEVMQSFKELAHECTTLTVLQHDYLEGDDLIAGYAQYFAAQGDSVVILSGDKDFVQLLNDKKISIINPDNGKERNLLDVCGVDSAEYFLFEKCFRGDSGDNVLPAFPRVRKTRLHKAFGVHEGSVHSEKADSFELSNLLNATWEHPNPSTGEPMQMLVQEMFNENNTLMNLSAQPEHVRKLINDVIQEEIQRDKQFNFFKFNKFIGKYELKTIGEKVHDFTPMFSSKIKEEPKINGLNL